MSIWYIKARSRICRIITSRKENIKTEFMFPYFAYNIKKLFNKTIKKRNGILLNQMKIA